MKRIPILTLIKFHGSLEACMRMQLHVYCWQ